MTLRIPHALVSVLTALTLLSLPCKLLASDRSVSVTPRQVIVTYRGTASELKSSLAAAAEFQSVPFKVRSLRAGRKGASTIHFIVAAPLKARRLGSILSTIEGVTAIQLNYRYTVPATDPRKVIDPQEENAERTAYITAKDAGLSVLSENTALQALPVAVVKDSVLSYSTSQAAAAISSSVIPATRVVLQQISPDDALLSTAAATSGFSQVLKTQTRSGQAIAGVPLAIFGGEYMTVLRDPSCVTDNGGRCTVSERMSKGERVKAVTSSRYQIFGGDIFTSGASTPQIIVVELKQNQPPTPTPQGTRTPSMTRTPSLRTPTPTPTRTRAPEPTPTRPLPTATATPRPPTPTPTVTPTSGGNNPGVQLAFSGKVSYASTGAPAPRVLIYAKDGGGSQAQQIALTNLEGAFRAFTFSTQGTVLVYPQLPLGCTADPAVKLVRTNGDNSVDFKLVCATPTASPTSTPAAEKLINGSILDDQGIGVSGISVKALLPDGTLHAVAVSGAGGKFTFPAFKGSVARSRITIEPVNAARYFTPVSSVVDLSVPQTSLRISFTTGSR